MNRAYVTPEPGASLQRGWQLYEWRRYGPALVEAQKFLARHPESANAQALTALCHGQEKRKAEALTAAFAAVKLAPDSSYVYYVLALVQFWFDDYEPAKRALKESLRLNPVDPDTFGLLASVHTAQGHFQAAVEVCEAGLARDAEHLGCHFQRANAFHAQMKVTEAEAGYHNVLRLDPEHGLAQAGLGRLALKRGDYAEAVPLLRQGLRQHPELTFLQTAWREALWGRYRFYRGIARMRRAFADGRFVASFGLVLLAMWCYLFMILFQWAGLGGGAAAWIILGIVAAVLSLAGVYLVLTMLERLVSLVLLAVNRDLRRQRK